MTTRIAHLEGLRKVSSTCERLTAFAPPKVARVEEVGRLFVSIATPTLLLCVHINLPASAEKTAKLDRISIE